ncbi:MAG: proton-conducting membrane transporter [Chlorobi bacterium]|nr:proton-conducting membrane transporter [Chlorobiota bacterium]
MTDPVYFIAIPLLTAFLLPLFGKIYKPLIGIIPGLVFAFTAYISFDLYFNLEPGKPVIVQMAGWAPPWGINLVFGEFSGLIVSLITFLAFLVWVYSYNFKKVGFDNSKKYFTLLMLMVAGSIGVVLTGDIFNMFVFLEITAISSYGLTAFYKGRDSAEAAFKFLLIGSLSSTFILLAILLLYKQTGTLNMAEIAIKSQAIDPKIKSIIAILFFVGFGIEAEMFPLNGWVPDAYSQAPGPVAASFASILAKSGIYALIRVFYTVLDVEGIFNLLLTAGLLTIIFAEFTAMRQTRLRRMLAYSSIGQMGLIMVAFSFNTKAGVFAGLFLMFNHAVIKTLLFLASGFLTYSTKQKKIRDLDGFGKIMPFTSLMFGLGAFAIVGLPPFSGFWGKLNMLTATADSNLYLVIALILVVAVVEIIYYFKVIGRLYFRERHEDVNIQKPTWNAVLAMSILALVIIGVGLYPDFITDYLAKATNELFDKAGYIKHVLPSLSLN